MSGDMLSRGVDMLNRVRGENMSVPVTYHRGSAAIEMVATWGQSQYERSDEGGFTVHSAMMDFIVLVSAMLIDEVAIRPRPGDLIETSESVFQVVDVSASGCYQTIALGTCYRIHCAIIS